MSAEQPTMSTEQSTSQPQEQLPQQPSPQQQQPGGEPDGPPLESAQFPAGFRAQQGAPQAQSASTNLIRPPPGGLQQSPEELTRNIGFRALAEAVTGSAVKLYPQ